MHNHNHHHSPAAGEAVSDGIGTGRAFLIGIVLNTIFVAAEFAAGFIYNSMGLLADAGHNLGDVGGLLLSMTAFILARRRHAKNYTYGFRKATILASLANAVILFAAVGAIAFECIQKFRHPAEIGGLPIIVTAGIGIIINGATVIILNRGRKGDLNVRGAYLHMLADTLVSVGVVASGGLIMWTGLSIIDPIVGLLIAAAILVSAWGLMRESIRLSLDGIPEGVDIASLVEHMEEDENVAAVHHVHVWPISTTENALTAHVVLRELADLEPTRNRLRAELRSHGIPHSTLEFETGATVCPDTAL
ncbi:MAG: cation diffusion facilitator family transporter [Victivallaceae bacterium]|nr:cation diffusion facilitator family transporter [Victivallaceae bacterium]